MRRALVIPLALLAAALGATAADLPVEQAQVAPMPEEIGPHWVWVPDRLLRHSLLFSGDTGRVIGTIDAGVGVNPKTPILSRDRLEIYSVDTVYSRGMRGTRRDFVTIYDARTLAVSGEVEIPPRTADTATGVAIVALLDESRFLLVFNQTPASSVSVVDLAGRRLVTEFEAAGCAGVYPAGSHRFGMLCGNGTALLVELEPSGELARTARSEPFFDVVEDPVTEKGVRDGSRWWFASFEGHLHEIDFSGDRPVASERWSLIDEGERADSWRIGGAQHLALHRASGRLYSLVHRGGSGSHKDAGSEIWIYDLAARQRVERLEAPNLLPAFLRPYVKIETGSWGDWLLGALLPNLGVHCVAVSQDDEPLLFLRNTDVGAVAVLDARSGEHLRDLEQAGMSGARLEVP